MFVKEKQVRQGRGIGAGDKVGQNEVTSVETNGSREYKPEFFGEGR